MSDVAETDDRCSTFSETADRETASDDYATRFAGPVGAWMLGVQERLTMGLLRDRAGAHVIDVGGGHAQLAIPLCRAGYRVRITGSAPACAHRLKPALEQGHCSFEVADSLALPYADRAYDVAISFRLVTHCSRWKALIGELCRVASDVVIVDYPTSQSANCIAPALFGAKKKVETNTRTWTLFRHEEIREAFAAHGFKVNRVRKQFFLPMVLHRMLRLRALSAALEGICRALGLTRLWGSPVIVEAVRVDRSGD